VANATVLKRISEELGVRVLSVTPADITLRTGTPELKSVPLVVEHGIECRPGFMITTDPTADRASVTLKGIAAVLAPLTKWSTKKILLDDVHESLTIDVPLSDSLSSRVNVMPRSVRVHIPVQQVADATIEDVEVSLDKGLAEMGYAARPSHLRVTVRGGVNDLAELTRLDLRCQISGAPANGVVIPTVMCPRGMRVIACSPHVVRLVRRQVASLRNSSDESP
jgi:YbbR domain-containing protein